MNDISIAAQESKKEMGILLPHFKNKSYKLNNEDIIGLSEFFFFFWRVVCLNSEVTGQKQKHELHHWSLPTSSVSK